MMRFLIAAAVILVPGLACASDFFCEVVAIRDTPAEKADDVIKRGAIISTNQYNIVKATGRPEVCEPRGACYYMVQKIEGKPIETLLLTNCKVGKFAISAEGRDAYDLVPIPERSTAKELGIEDAANKLADLGVDRQTAPNAAEKIFNKPNSKCARVAKLALHGNKLALDKLNGDTDLGCNN